MSENESFSIASTAEEDHEAVTNALGTACLDQEPFKSGNNESLPPPLPAKHVIHLNRPHRDVDGQPADCDGMDIDEAAKEALKVDPGLNFSRRHPSTDR